MRPAFLLALLLACLVRAQQYYPPMYQAQAYPMYPDPMFAQPQPQQQQQPDFAAQPQTQSSPSEQCTSGPCCSETKTFLPAGEPCRATSNPCEETARCNGQSAQCPENPKKSNGVSCLVNGKCTDGYCVEYDLTGLCTQDNKIAADGTPCGTEGKCEKGTCTVYRDVDPHVKKMSAEEQEVIKKAQKQVKGELEALLRAHARYIKNREAFKGVTDLSAAQGFEAKLGLTNVTGHNQAAALASGNVVSTTGFSTTTIVIICGLALIVIAVLIIFVIKPKERMAEKKPKAPKKKSHGEDMTNADYDPPAF